MFRRALTVLMMLALMACFGAMLPSPAPAAPMTTHHAGCMHHHAPDATCHDCPICAGADLPRFAAWNTHAPMPPAPQRAPARVTALTGIHPASLDRPPRA
ncbi:hypothetical protein [Novosphingobium sp.]|uniref:hypothetical protein n=1 Tax=Novosphingobium sp. TaxID=1874826 RepID=UPI003D14D540